MRATNATGIVQRMRTGDISCGNACAITIALRVCALAIFAVAAFGCIGAVPAAGASWTSQTVSWPTLAEGQLKAVSCSTPSTCVAVGSSPRGISRGAQRVLAERWDGSSWVSEDTPEPVGASSDVLKAVSCASASGCEAVGSYVDSAGVVRGMLERRSGSGWRLQRTLNEDTSLNGVSCRPSGFCMAVGGRLIARWSRSGWSTTQAPSGISLTAVSCTGPRVCAAVGSRRGRALAGRWNGKAWSWQLAPNHFAGDYGRPGYTTSVLRSVSCSSAAACTAVGSAISYCGNCNYDWSPASASLAERWNGRRWTVQHVSDFLVRGSAWTAVSCPERLVCVAVGLDTSGHASASHWNGTKWTGRPLTPPGIRAVQTGFQAVSCASARTCETVGSGGLGVTVAERWDGARWRAQLTSSVPNLSAPGSLAGVSCTPDGSCVAVGNYENAYGTTFPLAERWDGATWSTHAIPGAGPNGQMSAVSCASASACIAIGASSRSTPLVERWDGSSWSREMIPKPKDAASWQLNAVSCASANACTLVGQFFPNTGSPGHELTIAEHWDGMRWTIQNTANPSASTTQPGAWLSAVSCTSQTQCIAVGGGNATMQAEEWDGARWSLQQTPPPAIPDPSNGLVAVSCAGPAFCAAVGPGGQPQFDEPAIADMWNGIAWSAGTPAAPAESIETNLHQVSCASATACSAVGYYLLKRGGSQPLAEAWDGTSWTIQAVPIPNEATESTSLNAVSCTSPTTCVAVGEKSRGPFAEDPVIERLS
jgi:hypothetical protein